MVSFLVRAAGSTGGKVLLAGILVAAGSRNKDIALTAATIVGYILSALLLLAPLYTFVKPIREEQDVGARTPYGHISTMASCIAWTLYAVPTFLDNILTVIINGAGILLEFGYVVFFLCYAVEDARRLPLYLLVAVLIVSVVLTVLVVVMVIAMGVRDTKFIGVIASAATGISYLFVLADVVEVLKTKTAKSNLDPLIEVLLNLSNASTWTVSAFLPTQADVYSGIPNVVGTCFLVAQLVAYLLYRRGDDDLDRMDADDFGFELRALFESQVQAETWLPSYQILVEFLLHVFYVLLLERVTFIVSKKKRESDILGAGA